MKSTFVFSALLTLSALTACNNEGSSEEKSEATADSITTTNGGAIKEEAVSYTSSNTTLNGYLAYDSSQHR